jgi:hypothetical protein
MQPPPNGSGPLAVRARGPWVKAPSRGSPERARGEEDGVLSQAMAFWRLASMAARKSWVFSHGLSLEMSSARSLVI